MEYSLSNATRKHETSDTSRGDSKGNVGREGTCDTSPGRGRTLRLAENRRVAALLERWGIMRRGDDFLSPGRGNVGTPKISLTAGGTT